MPKENYKLVEQVSALNRVIDQGAMNETNARNALISKMNGIEGLPYQFMENVDRRINGTEIGRKFTEKIVSKMPLLFITPCKASFMADFDESDKQTVANLLVGHTLGDTISEITSDLIIGRGRYYAVEFDYYNYYNYLNVMLSSVAGFLGIYNEKININGRETKLGLVNWANELNSDFASFFSAKENVVFYLDGLNSVDESYDNETGPSSIASSINGMADTSNELRFLIGDASVAKIIDGAGDILGDITSTLSGITNKLVGGSIVESLADGGVKTIINGGKIIFPDIWTDSSSSRSFSLTMKLRSPDHDSLSIFLNILKPYCRLLALTLPKMMENDPNGYKSPFLVKAACKGLFNIDMGIISSMSVTKGAECCWNDDGLPTQIDVSFDIKDLYNSLSMSGLNQSQVVTNTSYLDFLANMAGLNINQMEIGKRTQMRAYLLGQQVSNIPSRAFTTFDQYVSKFVGNIYDIF